MDRREFTKKSLITGLAIPVLPSLFGFETRNNKSEGKYKVYVNNKVDTFSQAGMVSMQLNPMITLTLNGKTEVLIFESLAILETNNPRKNSKGFRHQDILVKEWEGQTKSKLLNKNVGFKVSDTHWSSSIISEKLNQDFPANFNLNIEFDFLIEGEVMKTGIAAYIDSFFVEGLHSRTNQIYVVSSGETQIDKNFSINFCAA